MHKYNTYLVVLLLQFFAGINNAQVTRPVDEPRGFGGDDDIFFETDTLDQPIDTTGQIIYKNTDTINFRTIIRVYDQTLTRKKVEFEIDDVHRYQVAQSTKEPTRHLGVNGRPLYPLTWLQPYSENLDIGFNQYADYKMLDKDIKYYKAQRPFTKMRFVSGTERENVFDLEHTQNWGRGMNVGFQYERLVTNGIYANQEVDHNRFGGHAWYQGKNKRFNMVAHYIFNKYVVGEMGGIVDTTDYFSNEDFNRRRSIPVRISDGDSKYKGNNLRIQNSYDIGKLVKLQINDTVVDNELVPAFRIQHVFQYKKDLYRYDSPNKDSLFFTNFLINPDGPTADTLIVKSLSNEGRLRWLGNKLGEDGSLQYQNFLADAYARFTTYNLEGNAGFTDELSDLVVGGKLGSNPADTARVLYSAKGAYHLLNYRQGDYYLRGDLGYDLTGAVGKLSAYIEWLNQEPHYTSQKLVSNHYNFNNNFDKINARSIGAEYANDVLGLTASVRFTNASNVLYYNTEHLPVQDNGSVSYVLLGLHKYFRFGKFESNLRGWYQTSSNDKSVRVPNFLARADVFYKGPLFKNKLSAKTGLEVAYVPKYNLDGFDPALGQFHEASLEYAGQPEINFFASFQLSRARLFGRLDRLDDFLRPKKPTFVGYRLPNHDFVYRVGISWVLVN